MDQLQLVLFLSSLLFSFGIALLIQKMKRPQLEMQIGKHTLHNQDRMKITHIAVRNKPIRVLGSFMNRDLATNCVGTVRVRDASTGQMIKEFTGLKWATNPEPLKIQVLPDKKVALIPDSAVMMTAGLKNLGQRWEDLDIAVKHADDEEFYINTLHNYPLNLKPPETRIDARRCFIDIRIEFDNDSSDEKRFHLRNDSTKIIDFELSKEPYR